MHHKPVVHGQFRRQLVNRQIGLSRDPRTYPILDTCQLAAPRIALRLGRKRPGLALEPHHVVDELDRNVYPSLTPNICLKGRKSQIEHHGNPESDQDRHALAFRANGSFVLWFQRIDATL
jgi:hypothetical protein